MLIIMLAGCSSDEPIYVGFIGGLSDRNSDVGQSGYKGVLLAVEQANRSGGVHGRAVELIARDDSQDKDVAARSARELVAAGVEGVIGPFTSGIASVVAPIFGDAKILTISPTVSALSLYGRDDFLFRINRTTRDNARDYARVLHKRGQRRIAVAYDTRNREFTESWLDQFRIAMRDLGCGLAAEVAYESRTDTDFGAVIGQMLAARPDGLFFLSGALDVARLAQQARRLAPQLPIGASEWAGTEQLVDLGGKVVDGLLIVQNHNREGAEPRYQAFREAYFKRFNREPGYSSVLAHDAATVLLEALRKKRRGETTKEAVLKYGPYPGLQQEIRFDANGDTERTVFFTEIRDGRYHLVSD
jgi:branched-chain amino acid transport system substrate-binding protein